MSMMISKTTSPQVLNQGVASPGHKYVDSKLLSLDHVIDSAKEAFLRKKEERRIKNLYEKVCGVKMLPPGRPLGNDMYQMLEEMNISRLSVPGSLKYYEILLKTQCVPGIGYENENGGLSFYSPKIGEIANIGEDGITMLYNKENQKSTSICVFENFLDFLAYRTLMSLGKRYIYSDVLVMNSTRNFIHCMFESENYKQVLCFFHRDSESSLVMSETVMQRMVGTSKDMSYIYSESGSNSLLEFIQTIDSNTI